MPIIKILPHAEYCPEGAEVSAPAATSICEALLEHHIHIEHACEMSCACTTCHVIVKEGFESLAPSEEEEDDLLDRAWGLQPNSRLSCQAILTQKNLVIEIPKYSINHAKEKPLMRQVFLDTETTGLSADNGDRIIEIGCVEMLHRKLTGNNRHIYVNPGRDSHEEALKVHGITTEFLKDKPKFSEIAEDLMDYLNGAHVVIHNAPFDLGFLNMELALLGQPPVKSVVASITDTLVMAKELYPGKRNSLDALCDRLEVDNSGRTLHGALLDAELLADVYINLTRGQEALLMDDASALDASGNKPAAMDLSGFVLPVIQANPQELEGHEAVLVQIDKESKGKTVWRTLAA